MTDRAYRSWVEARRRGEVPVGFADGVVAAIAGDPIRATGWERVGWGARAALLLVGVGVLLLRVGSSLATFLLT